MTVINSDAQDGGRRHRLGQGGRWSRRGRWGLLLVLGWAACVSRGEEVGGDSTGSGIAVPVNQVSSTETKTPKLEPSSLSGQFMISTSRSVNVEEPNDFAGTYRLSLKYKSKNWSASTELGYILNYSKELEEPEYGTGQVGDFEDPKLGLTTKRDVLTEGFSIQYGLNATAPLSKLTTKRSFRGSLGPSLGYSYQNGRWLFNQTLGYRYAFYEYEIRDNGVTNSPHNLSLLNSITYDITEKLQAGVSFLFRHSISFQGVGRNQTLTTASLDWSPIEKVSIGTGVETLAGTLSPDGGLDRLYLYEPGLAQVFLDLSLNF